MYSLQPFLPCTPTALHIHRSLTIYLVSQYTALRTSITENEVYETNCTFICLHSPKALLDSQLLYLCVYSIN